MNNTLTNNPMLGVMLFVLLASITSVLTAHVVRHKAVVEFDINDTITTFEHNIAQSQLSDEKRLSEIKRFTQTLDETVAQYAHDNNVIVLVSPAVVGGALNVTKDIQQQLVDTLKAQNQAKRVDMESNHP